jgi:5-methylcytosine-specific restriction endonuclease McrA
MPRSSSGGANSRQILEIVRTDCTFVQQMVRGEQVWVGRCLHCNTRLIVALNGQSGREVTVEHIIPRSAGGGDELLNLGLACARCNHLKGVRHDSKGLRNPRAAEVIGRLLERRRARFRLPTR